MTDNIIPMPTPKHVLVERIQKAHTRAERGRHEWVEGRIEEARLLVEVRQAFGENDRALGIWLAENGLDYFTPNDRAALIHLAKTFNDDDLRFLFLQFMEDQYSPRTIWNIVIEKRLAYASKRINAIVQQVADMQRNANANLSRDGIDQSETRPSSNTEEKAPLARQNNEPAAQTEPQEQGPAKIGAKSGIHGRPYAEELYSIFLTKKTRGTLGHLNGSAWKLLLQAYKAGLLPTPTDVTIKQPTARFFFPYGSGHHLNGFDLTSRAGRSTAVDLLTQMIAHKDELLAEPERVEAILAHKEQTRKAEQRAALVQERATKALAALPPDESEVIMFGKRLWPIIEGETIGAYDFRTLQVAVWKFTDLNRWMHRDSPGSRAINIRNSTKWDRHFIGELLKDNEVRIKIDRIYQLVHAIARLMEENPDGECKEPLTPLVLG